MPGDRILIVEDEKDVRDVLSEILSLFGFQVTEAADGPEALQHVVKKEFDLIITDLGLPGMDGAELVRRIRESYSKIPILIITGVEIEKRAADFGNVPNCSLIQKPFKMEDLKIKINKYLSDFRNHVSVGRKD